MSFHSLGAQIQQYSDLLGTLSFSEKLGDFTFAGGQCRQIRRRIPGYGMSLLQETRQDQVVYSRREKHPLALQGFYCGHQIASRVRFKHESAGPRIKRLTNYLIGIGDGQHYDFELRVVLQQLAGRIQAIEVWHAYVHDDDIGLQLLGHLNGLAPIGCLSANFPPFVLLEQRAQASAHDFVIIGQQNTKFHGILQA
jgi:hypothetical protein